MILFSVIFFCVMSVRSYSGFLVLWFPDGTGSQTRTKLLLLLIEKAPSPYYLEGKMFNDPGDNCGFMLVRTSIDCEPLYFATILLILTCGCYCFLMMMRQQFDSGWPSLGWSDTVCHILSRAPGGRWGSGRRYGIFHRLCSSLKQW